MIEAVVSICRELKFDGIIKFRGRRSGGAQMKGDSKQGVVGTTVKPSVPINGEATDHGLMPSRNEAIVEYSFRMKTIGTIDEVSE